ncbi:hypothetical protein D3C86_1695340 [compost metagenome]
MPRLLKAKVWLAVMPKRCCITVGVITTSTTTADVNTQVRIIAGSNASRCSRKMVRRENSTTSSRRLRMARKTGVSFNQRRNHTAKTPNTPPSRNGKRQA